MTVDETDWGGNGGGKKAVYELEALPQLSLLLSPLKKNLHLGFDTLEEISFQTLWHTHFPFMSFQYEPHLVWETVTRRGVV